MGHVEGEGKEGVMVKGEYTWPGIGLWLEMDLKGGGGSAKSSGCSRRAAQIRIPRSFKTPPKVVAGEQAFSAIM
ncbi:hypothetical protein HPP92_006354 [Vanilla planifolia]|uniref:Uncharacterized protein n=1 Tax=Vanilla planifolia TaxID=51239 RepID=A0A835VE13_VANPL|nr:hypothetical protein HPP92_006354 [Vanilla planifolia]